MELPIIESTSINTQAGALDAFTPRPSTYAIVASWHADAGHVGRFAHCTEQPCHAIHFTRRVS